LRERFKDLRSLLLGNADTGVLDPQANARRRHTKFGEAEFYEPSIGKFESVPYEVEQYLTNAMRVP
jgi:hypothetical protein